MRYQALAIGLLVGQGLCAPAPIPEVRNTESQGSEDADLAGSSSAANNERRSPQYQLQNNFPQPIYAQPFNAQTLAANNGANVQQAPQTATLSVTQTKMVTVTTLITVLTLTTVITGAATPEPVVAATPTVATAASQAAPANQVAPAWLLSYQASHTPYTPPARPSPPPRGNSGSDSGSGAGAFFASLLGFGGSSPAQPTYYNPQPIYIPPPPGVAPVASSAPLPNAAQPVPTPAPTAPQGLGDLMYGSQAPGWAQLVGTLLLGPLTGGGGGGSGSSGGGSGWFGGLGGFGGGGGGDSDDDGPGRDSYPTDRPQWTPRPSRPRPYEDRDPDYSNYQWPSVSYIPEVLLPNGSVSTTISFKKWRPKLKNPSLGPTFQIILSGVPDLSEDAVSVVPDVDIYDIDLFLTSKSTIDTLHRLGKTVVCYFSAGTYEPGRPDSRDFNSTDIGMPLAQWPKERWVYLPSERIRNIMKKRIALAHAKGCDAIDPDNVDGYQTSLGGGFYPGPRLTAADTIEFVKFLSNEATLHGMAVGLKNALDILPAVTAHVHFAVNEECVKNRECHKYNDFLGTHNKPVFHIEYPPPPAPKPPPPPPPPPASNGTNVTVTTTYNPPANPGAAAGSSLAGGFGAFVSQFLQGQQEGGGPRVTAADLIRLEPEDRDKWCDSDTYAGQSINFSTVLKEMSLNGFVEYCNGSYATTPTMSNERAARLSQTRGRNRNNDDDEKRRKMLLRV